MGKPIWGKGANDHDSAQLEVLTIPHNFEWRKSVKRLQRYGFRKSGSRPPDRPPAPWRQYPSSPEGWGVKNDPMNAKNAEIINYGIMRIFNEVT